MKLMLSLLIIVMLKCNRLSSAPTDLQAESHNSSSNRKNDEVASITKDRDGEESDSSHSGIIFPQQFRRSIRSNDVGIEARRRSAIDKGFMRFGRANNMVRFGRSMPTSEYDNEEISDVDEDDDTQINEPYSMKMRRGSNIMRFGKRFYQNLDNDDYSDDAAYELIDQPVRRNPENNYSEQGSKILRLGRSSSEISSSGESAASSREKKPTDGNILRFGRGQNFVRFGRASNMLRFGRGDNMMRFGRAGNVMRFGKRTTNEFPRLSRANNVLRFGRSDKNPMRFGKRDGSSTRIYCDDYNCLEKENQLIVNDNDEQLRNLFGVTADNNDNDDNAKQSPHLHNEYIIT